MTRIVSPPPFLLQRENQKQNQKEIQTDKKERCHSETTIERSRKVGQSRSREAVRDAARVIGFEPTRRRDKNDATEAAANHPLLLVYGLVPCPSRKINWKMKVRKNRQAAAAAAIAERASIWKAHPQRANRSRRLQRVRNAPVITTARETTHSLRAIDCKRHHVTDH